MNEMNEKEWKIIFCSYSLKLYSLSSMKNEENSI